LDNHYRKDFTMSTETIQQQVPTGTYVVDPVHSSIGFAVVHNGVSTFRSGFGAYEARLSGGENPELKGSVEVAGIQIDEPQLKGHLLSPDFFDAERYPQLRFESSALEVGEDGTATIRGELEAYGHGLAEKTEIVGLNRMFQLDLRRMKHATLVSCWAADNFVLPGRWVVSLPEVLWRAGAASVVGSLWQVSEDCAGQFVQKFYKALPSHTVDRAAQQAILALMRNGAGPPREPVDWAGFQVYGEPQKLRLGAS